MKKIITDIKDGFSDVNAVVRAGKYKLLLPPVIFLLVIWFASCKAYNAFSVKKDGYKAQVSALQNQKERMAAYPALKAETDKLSGQFMAYGQNTGEWLYGVVIDVFGSQAVSYDFSGNIKEENGPGFVLHTLNVRFTTTYPRLGALTENIENIDKFVRISSLVFSKNDTSPGLINVEMQLSAVFLQ